MTTLFITYSDVCSKIAEKNKLKEFHSQRKFTDVFQLVFKFDERQVAEIILQNWEKAICSEIKNCNNFNLINEAEAYQIKRITLQELTVIVNLGKYAKNTLKMKSYIAMVFALGIYYSTFIFEQTGLCLTIAEIYNTIPEGKRTKNGYKSFLKSFFKEGTSDIILKILSQTKV